MYKTKLFIDFANEETWLKSMAEQGWLFTGLSAFGRYHFVQGEPNSWNYRVDYRTFKAAGDFADYVQLFDDSGWRHVGGNKNSGSQYFVQVRPETEDDIFSDAASKAARYHRQSVALFFFSIVFFVFLVSYIANGLINLGAFFRPQEFYFTPDLWEKTGAEFWRAFLFETPFALWRGYAWLLFVFAILSYAIVALKSYLAGKGLRYPAAKYNNR